MATTKEDISGWFDEGVSQRSKYMIVVCDTFDHEDYPCYAESDAQCLAKVKDPGDMQRVMEVYDLRENKDEQMKERRAMRLPKKEATK